MSMESVTFIAIFWVVSMWVIMAVGWFLYGRDRSKRRMSSRVNSATQWRSVSAENGRAFSAGSIIDPGNARLEPWRQLRHNEK